MVKEDPQLLNVQKAASFLGVSTNTIRLWAQKDKLNGVKVGSRGDWRFSKEELSKMIQPEKKILDKVKKLLIENANDIQKDSTEHHIRFLGDENFRHEFVRKYKKNHIKIVKTFAENLDSDLEEGTMIVKNLGETLAKDSLNDGLTIEETVDGIVFLKQAIWHILDKEGLLKKITTQDFYRISQSIGTYSDVLASIIAFTYHGAFKDQLNEDLNKYQESQGRLSTIVDSAMDAIVSKNLDGIIKSWNKGAEELFGYKEKEAIGKHISLIIPTELIKEEDVIIGKIKQGIRVEHFETTRQRKDGSKVTVSISVSPVKTNQGKIIGASKIARDMTERKKYEEQLQYLATLTQNIRDAVISTDADYQITSWNKGAEEIYGWKEEEVIGKTASDVLKTKYSTSDSIESLTKNGYWSGEVVQKRKDNTDIFILASVAILKDSHGNVIGGVGVNRDISERKQVERNMQFLSEASKIITISLDYKTTLQSVAKIAISYMGDWCGVDMLDAHGELQPLAIAHRDPKKLAWAKEYRKQNPPKMTGTSGVPSVIKTGKSLLYPMITDEMLVASAQNKKHLEIARSLNITSLMIVPILIKNKAIGAISFVTADGRRQYTQVDLAVAEELAARASLAIENAQLYQRAQREIEQRRKLEKQKDEFIGVASHELKTPVTSIKSFAQVLRLRFAKEGNQSAAELLGKLDVQVDKLTNLIGDLLDVTKIEAGRMQFVQEYFSFDELVNELGEELQRTTEKHLLMKEGTTGKIIFGDRERVGQVITNLISNAIKYSPKADKIVIKSSIDKGMVKLCVQDFGIGVEKDKQKKVFERFFRASGPGQETFPGLGLGLYVSSEIIKRLNGRIWVESNEKNGSTFCFVLPVESSKKKTS
jgi:PAS domain S-box-containing protein/excisionase family DNA binding protein